MNKLTSTFIQEFILAYMPYAVVCDGNEAWTSQRLLRKNKPSKQRVVNVMKKKVKLLGSFHYLKIVMLNGLFSITILR